METNYPVKVTLKGGETIKLRPIQDQDEQPLVEFFQALPRENTEFLKDDVRDPAVVQRFVKERDPDRVRAILAFSADKIVGDATLHVDRVGWRRHVGEIRVVVAPDFQKKRLATAMIHALVNQASDRGLRKLEAQILGSQLHARTAFERLGFREEDRLVDHAMDLDGRLHDLVILTNTVDDLWSKMENMIADMEIGRDGY